MIRTLARLAVPLVLVAVLAACGSDDDDSSASTTTTEAKAGKSTTTTAAESTTTGGGAGSTTTAGGAASSEFCEAAKALQEVNLDTADVKAFQEGYPKVIDAFEELADVAPEEFKADFQDLLDLYKELEDDVMGASTPAELDALGTKAEQQVGEAMTGISGAFETCA